MRVQIHLSVIQIYFEAQRGGSALTWSVYVLILGP